MTIQTTALPSGLRVVTDSRPDATTVALTVNIAAGSRHESESEHGLAHLLEHVAVADGGAFQRETERA